MEQYMKSSAQFPSDAPPLMSSASCRCTYDVILKGGGSFRSKLGFLSDFLFFLHSSGFWLLGPSIHQRRSGLRLNLLHVLDITFDGEKIHSPTRRAEGGCGFGTTMYE